MSPRISAPTVAEHRARQRAAILAAARALLDESGPAAVTLTAVGSAVGLARSSVYEYFPSVPDLLAEIVREAFAEWADRVADATAPAAPGLPRLEAYARAVLGMAAQGQHNLSAVLGGMALPPACRDHLARLHQQLQEPVLAALRELSDPSPELTAALVHGLVSAAMLRLDAGDDVAEVTATTVRLLRSGVGAPAAKPPGRQAN